MDFSYPVKGSIQNLDIKNVKRVFFKRSREVVKESKDLGMSFNTNEEAVGNLAERILHKA